MTELNQNTEPIKEPITEPIKEPIKEPITEPIKEPIKSKPRHVCNLCGDAFATRQTLQSHYSNGVCLGKGYMCLRCFKVKRTPHELQRHQRAETKCKPATRASVRRDENGNVNIIIKR